MEFTPNRKAIALGTIAGLRSATAAAVAARCLTRKRFHRGAWALLASPTTAGVLTAIAAELVADKVIRMPRTAPGPLAARITSGALSGAAMCAADGATAGRGALIGALAAVAGAFGFQHLRKRLAHGAGIPQQVVGLAEDALVVGLGRKILKH